MCLPLRKHWLGANWAPSGQRARPEWGKGKSKQE